MATVQMPPRRAVSTMGVGKVRRDECQEFLPFKFWCLQTKALRQSSPNTRRSLEVTVGEKSKKVSAEARPTRVRVTRHSAAPHLETICRLRRFTSSKFGCPRYSIRRRGDSGRTSGFRRQRFCIPDTMPASSYRQFCTVTAGPIAMSGIQSGGLHRPTATRARIISDGLLRPRAPEEKRRRCRAFNLWLAIRTSRRSRN